jgi:hypothetical protein
LFAREKNKLVEPDYRRHRLQIVSTPKNNQRRLPEAISADENSVFNRPRGATAD